ncbi:hypothetical protein PsorP6_009889 [Peronosclerospora sorghi]|uniref:Uncharacterized protein n=1 Tax=Peronosclerospora sorghi TaxID=230839 RepID=A0ACC0W0S2_9STRA|nr:hypothetical protein PsorP6_009889 [Peronosclerospora sorghi]
MYYPTPALLVESQGPPQKFAFPSLLPKSIKISDEEIERRIVIRMDELRKEMQEEVATLDSNDSVIILKLTMVIFGSGMEFICRSFFRSVVFHADYAPKYRIIQLSYFVKYSRVNRNIFDYSQFIEDAERLSIVVYYFVEKYSEPMESHFWRFQIIMRDFIILRSDSLTPSYHYLSSTVYLLFTCLAQEPGLFRLVYARGDLLPGVDGFG